MYFVNKKGDFKLRNAIKVISIFLVVLLISAYFAYAIVSIDVKPVEDFTVSEKGLTYQELSWHENEKVSGYKIYQKNAENDNYTLIKTIKGGNKTSCKIKNLDMESFYSFKISAYASFFGKEYEGELSKAVETCTLPRGEDVESIVEQTINSLTISWEKGMNCDGYEIEYSEDENFFSLKVHNAKGINTTMCKIDGLEQGETYYVRMRSYIKFKGETLYSNYSDTYSATITNIASPVGIDPTRPVIALTFDDGPNMSSSDKVLDVLERYGVRATFFVVGENAEKHPENIKRKLELGCEVGNHTNTHGYYGKDVNASEIIKCSDVLEKITGSRPTIFRATGGITNSNIKKVCKQQGMSLFYWTVDTEDWKYKNANKVYRAAKKAKDGDIILMHDIYDTTAKAVEKLIPKLLKKGYQFVTVTELVKYKSDSAPKPGVHYLNGEIIKK